MHVTQLVVAALGFFHQVHGCSNFLLNHTTSVSTQASPIVVSARTMDFDADLATVLEVIPRNTTFNDLPVFACPTCPDFSWRTQYGYVGFNVFGLNVASDGLNEQGLSAAMLYLVGTKYELPSSADKRPALASFVSYMLGNCATVDDVKNAIKQLQLVEPLQPGTGGVDVGRIPLHYVVHDKHGSTLVVELVDNQVHMYENVSAVITNEPPLDVQLAELQALNKSHASPGSYSPEHRFQRLSLLNEAIGEWYAERVASGAPNPSYANGTEEQRAITDAMHLINTVVVPLGDATQWSVIRDHVRKTLYVQTQQNQVPRRVRLDELDFKSSSSRRAIPVTFGGWFADVTDALSYSGNTQRTIDLPPRSVLQAASQAPPPKASSAQSYTTPEPTTPSPSKSQPATSTTLLSSTSSTDTSGASTVVLLVLGCVAGVVIVAVAAVMVARRQRMKKQSTMDSKMMLEILTP
ncbi:TPA: hypothetical protein N0F65_002972 [Lagenidium giganteum]|uniref:Choloylglycine hydrolase/NAAA C-terminal domain-containing protein n=1 Tax=Lagenidium giganteum TaxID=4803 RepID=A0AAV2YP02_9STRA|nr:TPA: hypothetical protein N0F65_002972 [Lagenidium giganteum]